MTLFTNSKFLILICGTLSLLWMITLLAYWREKRKVKIVKKNSDWAADKAREKAEGIIQEAKNAALRELSDVKIETDKFEKELEAGVKSLTDQEISQYKGVISGITEHVERGVKEQSEQFKTEFNTAWKKMENEMQAKIKEDYDEERKKIEEYTGVKMREIEEKVAGISDEAVLLVLGKQVDSQINKKLILEALDEVKRSMQSDIWQNIYFWNEYGKICNEPQEDGVKKELEKVKRIVIEAGGDMPEEDWIDVARRAKNLFGAESVLDIMIRKNLIGGGRVSVEGNMFDNSVLGRFRRWQKYE